jgi:hypothetical protein
LASSFTSCLSSSSSISSFVCMSSHLYYYMRNNINFILIWLVS